MGGFPPSFAAAGRPMRGRLGRAVRRSVDGKGLKVWVEGGFEKIQFRFFCGGRGLFLHRRKTRKMPQTAEKSVGNFCRREHGHLVGTARSVREATRFWPPKVRRTTCGSAPFSLPITWPIKAPTACCLPPLTSATILAFLARMASMIGASSPVSAEMASDFSVMICSMSAAVAGVEVERDRGGRRRRCGRCCW